MLLTYKLGLDSLNKVEALIAVEEVDVPDRAAEKFKCPNDIVKYIYEQCGDHEVLQADIQKMNK